MCEKKLPYLSFSDTILFCIIPGWLREDDPYMYKKAMITCTLLLLFFGAGTASAGSICPSGSFPYNPDNANTGCNIVITITNSGATLSIKDSTPYEESEDILVGVVNNGSSSVSSISLTGSGIFGFDGDGICTFTFTGSGYCSATKYLSDPGDYAGPTTSFPGWTPSSFNSGTVAFSPAILPGSSTYFSLEGTPSNVNASVTVSGGPSVPALSNTALVALVIVLAACALWAMRRREQTAA
jgi:hypothetical protein